MNPFVLLHYVKRRINRILWEKVWGYSGKYVEGGEQEIGLKYGKGRKGVDKKR